MTTDTLRVLLALGALAVPGSLAFAAAVPSPRRRLVLALAPLALLAVTLGRVALGVDGAVRWFAPLEGLTAVRLDVVAMVVLWLVGTVGAVLWRFSQAYLDGDDRLAGYQRAMLATLACVTGLVLADHLVVLVGCWTGTSLALHQLLTHFPRRPGAQLAAHKKFLASRMADGAMLLASLLLWRDLGTLSLEGIHQQIAVTTVTPGLQVAGLLIVLCVALKSAQLPFHGWLTQVMEAPTPVSALLHAGVVNMGGVVLLRLSGFLVHVPAAQTLMVLIGTTTAVLAGLVGSTQVSVKVSLAWSTMAQMGFMLLQCGLGAWPVALLHLVAHSLYKAHAFLSAGSAVDRARVAALVQPPSRPTLARWAAAGAAGLANTAAVGWVLGVDPGHEPALWVLGGVVGLAVAPLLAEARGLGHTVRAVVLAVVVAGAYFGWHALFARLVPPAPGPWLVPQLVIVAVGFGLGFAVQAILSAHPTGAVARHVRPWLAAGLYLDAWFTRLTFAVWPPALTPEPPRSLHLVRTSEIR